MREAQPRPAQHQLYRLSDPIPCPGHAGLGFREATGGDAPAILDHLKRLDASDRHLRFCGAVSDNLLARHVESLRDRAAFAVTAFDGPLWATPLRPTGKVRALAEIAILGDEAEIGISVDANQRRRGVGTCLTQTAGHPLAARGVRRPRATTLPRDFSMIELGRRADAFVEQGDGELVITFPVAALARAYLRRRLTAPMLRRAG